MTSDSLDVPEFEVLTRDQAVAMWFAASVVAMESGTRQVDEFAIQIMKHFDLSFNVR